MDGAVGYVLREFPYASETFVANEVLELERQGVALRLFSYRRPRRQPPHACFARIASPITYLPDPLPRRLPDVLGAHGAVLARDGAAYRRVARHALARAAAERDVDALRRFLQAGCLAALVQEDGVARLHAHFARGATRVAMLASMLTGLPFSFTAHARDLYADDVQRPFLREAIARAAFVVTVSEDNRAYLERALDAPPGKVRVVYNGVDLDAFAPDGAPREEALVLAVGRLVAKKGFSDLIEAVRLLRERGRAVRCEIAGDGPLRARLASEIAAAGLGDAVALLGERAQEELPALYRRAAVLALPAVVAPDGNRDALPTVLLEAMACATPVVSTRLGGIPEIVDHGVDGLLVAPGDASDLARALELLLGDASLRERLGAAARAKAQARFDVQRNVAELRALLTAAAPASATAAP